MMCIQHTYSVHVAHLSIGGQGRWVIKPNIIIIHVNVNVAGLKQHTDDREKDKLETRQMINIVWAESS